MHAELLSSLAAEHRRELTTSARRLPAAAVVQAQAPASPALVPLALVPAWSRRRRVLYLRAPRHPARALTQPRPRLRVNWSRTTLAVATERGRGRSLVIVISATRTL